MKTYKDWNIEREKQIMNMDRMELDKEMQTL